MFSAAQAPRQRAYDCASVRRENASKLVRLRFLESPKEVLHNGQGMAGGLTLERKEPMPGS